MRNVIYPAFFFQEDSQIKAEFRKNLNLGLPEGNRVKQKTPKCFEAYQIPQSVLPQGYVRNI